MFVLNTVKSNQMPNLSNLYKNERANRFVILNMIYLWMNYEFFDDFCVKYPCLKPPKSMIKLKC